MACRTYEHAIEPRGVVRFHLRDGESEGVISVTGVFVWSVSWDADEVVPVSLARLNRWVTSFKGQTL